MDSELAVICPNCGKAATGKYCSNCGFRIEKKRISVKLLLSTFLASLYHIEFKYFKTIKNLFLRPIEFIQEYIHGQRRQYYNPIKYFLINTGLNIGVITYYNIQRIENSINNPGAYDTTDQSNYFMNSLVENYAQFLYIAIIPFCILGAVWVYRSYKYNVAEQATAFFYMGGQMSLIAIPFNAITYFYHPFLAVRNNVVPTISLFMLFWLGYKFYENSSLNAFWKTIVIAIITVAGMAGLLFLIYYIKELF